MKNKPISINQHLIQGITLWACEQLLSLGYTLKSDQPESIKTTPWSYVIRFETSEGYVYLKHTPELLALEAPIIQFLHEQFHAAVPVIIAHNPQLNCFLMKDMGKVLRNVLKQNFDVNLLCEAIDGFSSMQLAVADHIDIFFNIGVPDWRLNHLPDLYQILISKKNLLLEDGLNEKEVKELEPLTSKIVDLCKNLSRYSIKETLVQCDFHDNNILIAEPAQTLTFIDLGEVVISHPFFSLVGFLSQVKKHHFLTNEDQAYHQLMDSCFKSYTQFESKENLLEAFSIAKTLWCLYEILCQYRLMEACGRKNLLDVQSGKLSIALRQLMKSV